MSTTNLYFGEFELTYAKLTTDDIMESMKSMTIEELRGAVEVAKPLKASQLVRDAVELCRQAVEAVPENGTVHDLSSSGRMAGYVLNAAVKQMLAETGAAIRAQVS